MIISPNPELADRLTNDMYDGHSAKNPRSLGWHASDLVYCTEKARLKYIAAGGAAAKTEGDDVIVFDSGLDRRTKLLFLLGHGFHQILQEVFGPGSVEKAVDFELPAGVTIRGTVDFVTDEGVPVEIKTTRAGMKKEMSSHYIEQLATYCLALGVTCGHVAVLHLVGDRGKDQRPELVVHDISFSFEELMRWREELNSRYRHAVGNIVMADDQTHYKWECGYCDFNKSVGGPCDAPTGRRQAFFVNEVMPEWVIGPGL